MIKLFRILIMVVSSALILAIASLRYIPISCPWRSLYKARKVPKDEMAEKTLAFYLGVGPTVQWSCDGTN